MATESVAAGYFVFVISFHRNPAPTFSNNSMHKTILVRNKPFGFISPLLGENTMVGQEQSGNVKCDEINSLQCSSIVEFFL